MTRSNRDSQELLNLMNYLRFRARQWVADRDGRTQQDLARASGLSPGTVSALVNGQRVSETAISALLRVFKLKWPDAFREADLWANGGKSGRSPSSADATVKTALAQLRHLYEQMVNGRVKDTAEAARGLLGPSIERIEKSLQAS